MATRRQIRDAFYNELETAVETSFTATYDDGSTETFSVPSDHITLIAPDALELRPGVVYDDDHQPRPVNGVGDGHVQTLYDTNGDATADVRRQYRTSIFTISVQADNEARKEPIYEAIATQFGQYQFPIHPASDVQSDIEDIRLDTADSADAGGEDDTIRSDAVVVQMDWHRDYEETGDVIDSVEYEVDADTDDATAGDTITTT